MTAATASKYNLETEKLRLTLSSELSSKNFVTANSMLTVITLADKSRTDRPIRLHPTMKRSRSTRGQIVPVSPEMMPFFPSFFFFRFFFFQFFSRYLGTGRCVPGFLENVPGLREIFSDIDFSDFDALGKVRPVEVCRTLKS